MSQDKFWPCVLQTVPPTIMTRAEAYAIVPRLHVTYIAATNPRPEHDNADNLPIPENHRRMKSW